MSLKLIFRWTGAILLSMIASFLYDFWKDEPVLSTLNTIFKWVWENVLNANLKIWVIIIMLFFIYTIRKLISAILKKEEKTISFLDYTTDFIKGTQWKWKWANNMFEGPVIVELTVICEKCQTSMERNSDSHFARCPRCDHRQKYYQDTFDIKAIILDNVERGLYKDIIFQQSKQNS